MSSSIKSLHDFELFQRSHHATLKLFQNLEHNSEDVFALQFDKTFAKLNFVRKGLPAITYDNSLPIQVTQALKTKVFDQETTAIAEYSGFLIIKSGVLDILPVVWINAKQTLAWAFIFNPTDLNTYWEETIQPYFDKIKMPSDISITTLKDFLGDSHGFSAICLSRGTESVSPIHSTVEFLIPPFSQDSPLEINERIDFREASPFKDVEANTDIFKIIKKKEGVVGVDVFGQTIPVPAAMDCKFQVGPGFTPIDTDEAIIYAAKGSGVLFVEKNKAEIRDFLRIQEVDYHTGNIQQTKDVVIEGDVLKGFKVECGGHLIIRGSVENGAHILCRGSCEIQGGVVGPHTTIICAQDLHLNYVSDAIVICQGSVSIEKYCFRGDIFAKESILVFGNGLKNTAHSVVGGSLNAIENIQCHSVGSSAERTLLAVGFHIKLRNRIRFDETKSISLSREIFQMQQSLGLDLNAPGSLQILQSLSESRKSAIKNLLLTIKEKSVEKEVVDENLIQLRKRLMEPKSIPYIRIEKSISPLVDIYISSAYQNIIQEIILKEAMQYVEKNGKIYENRYVSTVKI
jgi:uncharacterized protein (DUF342 family)